MGTDGRSVSLDRMSKQYYRHLLYPSEEEPLAVHWIALRNGKRVPSSRMTVAENSWNVYETLIENDNANITLQVPIITTSFHLKLADIPIRVG